MNNQNKKLINAGKGSYHGKLPTNEELVTTVCIDCSSDNSLFKRITIHIDRQVSMRIMIPTRIGFKPHKINKNATSINQHSLPNHVMPYTRIEIMKNYKMQILCKKINSHNSNAQVKAKLGSYF
jgi:hypothetical protein